MMELKQILLDIAVAIVDTPDEVTVVSEEDGLISHATKGDLFRGVSVEYVRGICYKYYGVKLDNNSKRS